LAEEAVIRITAVLLLLALLVTPVRAEITWVDAGQSYELSGAALLRLRKEMPADLQESLKPLRNAHFADEAAFRAALAPALLTDDLRAQWLDRLVELAATPGASYGTEPRGDILSLYVAGPDHALDANAFTSRSWLAHLPSPTVSTALAAAQDGACLVVSRAATVLFRLCQPALGDKGDKSVVIETTATHILGLGQEFQTPGDTRSERAGFVRNGTNAMLGFNGGANGNTLFPIAYFDLPGHPFALILDNRYPQEWDLKASPYRVRVTGGDLRFEVIAGDTLADIRRRYMAMAGHPPVPPKAMFGLWISEYGYENWAELDDKIASLKGAGFPLSGAVLDLYWFGGIDANSTTSRMGSLRWDETRFPDPAGKIKAYAAEGIGIMPIEESYISSGLPEYAALAEHHALAHNEAGAPVVTNPNGNWWGKGGMVDWTNSDGAAFWHDFRRQPLIDMGIAGHWTDLGEPEMVSPDFRYGPDSLTEQQVHNSYNLLWARSVYDGYQRNAPDKRPFILSRSGGMGMEQYGAAMWSGDTGGDFGSLAAQMPQQAHMMWSGMDYYGSDIGGFHREALHSAGGGAAMDELYTQWFAYSALFEVPVRPHTENLCNCKETAPDRVGDVASNLANIRLRYALEPYYYSLAFRAWLDGEPVFPALDYYYDDADAKGLGHEKMIGPSLVGAAVATTGANEVSLYLPAGDWYDFRSATLTRSSGETVTVPVHVGRLFALPVFARDGAIVPMADGVLRVFGDRAGAFDWYDDDGVSTAYQRGEYSQTRVTIDGSRLTIEPIKGSALARSLVWTRAAPVTAVTIDGRDAPFSQTGATLTVGLPSGKAAIVVDVR
jgi:alpha-glucosidase